MGHFLGGIMAKDELKEMFLQAAVYRSDALLSQKRAQEVEYEILKYLADHRMYELLQLDMKRFKAYVFGG